MDDDALLDTEVWDPFQHLLFGMVAIALVLVLSVLVYKSITQAPEIMALVVGFFIASYIAGRLGPVAVNNAYRWYNLE